MIARVARSSLMPVWGCGFATQKIKVKNPVAELDGD